METANQCPICKSTTKDSNGMAKTGDKEYINCPRCGQYNVTRTVFKTLPYQMQENEKQSSLLSYNIRRMQNSKDIPLLDSYLLEKLLQISPPSLLEQERNLILWIGNNTDPGEEQLNEINFFKTIMGSKSFNGAAMILNHLETNDLIIADFVGGGNVGIKLKIDGWQYYDEIMSGAVLSRRSFMAMKFGDSDLDLVFENCFKPAVGRAGFDLFRIDKDPKAGLIDDRLRVEIRTSRFLISDLSHDNPGAYWEAGYAEGLGKPVIYTCEKNKFETQKTHFDTNHHLTIIWEKNNLDDAAEQLTATIRATLPEDAKLIDDE